MWRKAFRPIGRALRAVRMVWQDWGRWTGGRLGSWLYGTLPGARVDYETEAGNVVHNAVVSIALGWIGDNIPEARLMVGREGEGGVIEPGDPRHAMLRLIRRPNRRYDSDALWAATAMSYSAFGNAYWFKARPRGMRDAPPVELYYLPHHQVQPYWRDETEFLTGYVYTVNGRQHFIRPEDIVHFRFGIDEQNQRLGVSRLYAVLREVVSDNALSTYLCALLRNMGIPGVLIAAKDATASIHPDQADIIRRDWVERYAGENAGKPFVVSDPVDVHRLGVTPRDMDLSALGRVPESRICGALRISPIVLQLGAGLDRLIQANYREARRQSYEDCLQPMHRRFGRTLDDQLLSDWEGQDTELVTYWDYSRVGALQDALTEIYRQNTLGVRGGWLQVNQALRRAGFAPVAGQDVFLRGGGGSPGSTGSVENPPQSDGTASEARALAMHGRNGGG